MKRCCTAVLVCPLRGFFCAVFCFSKNEIIASSTQENLRTTHLKVMSDSCITSCEPCAMDTDESWLERLPLDVQLRLVSYLDGPSLARLTECTSKRLAGGSKELGPHWAHLHGVEIAAAKVVPSKPQPDEPLAFAKADSPTSTLDANDVLGCKSALVRCRSAPSSSAAQTAAGTRFAAAATRRSMMSAATSRTFASSSRSGRALGRGSRRAPRHSPTRLRLRCRSRRSSSREPEELKIQ